MTPPRFKSTDEIARDLSLDLQAAKAVITRLTQERRELEELLRQLRADLEKSHARERNWPPSTARAIQNGRYIAKLGILNAVERLLKEQAE